MDLDDDKDDLKVNPKSRGRKSRSRKKNKSRGKTSEITEDNISSVANNLDAIGMSEIGFTNKSYRPSINREQDAFPLMFHGCGACDGLFAFAQDSWDANTAKGVPALSSGLWLAKQSSSLARGPRTPNGAARGRNPLMFITNNDSKSAQYKMFPKTPYAKALRNEAWPTMSTLFESGIRANVNINFTQWVCVIARVHYLYSSLMVWNQLATVWENTRDSSDDIPRAITKICIKLGIVKSANRSKLATLNSVVQTLPVLPNIVLETRRMLTAYINPLSPNTWVFPMYGGSFVNREFASSAFTESLVELTDVVDELFSDFTDEMAFMSTFMPDTVASTNATEPGVIAVDPIRSVGFYNTDFNTNPETDRNAEGTENWPVLVELSAVDYMNRMPVRNNPTDSDDLLSFQPLFNPVFLTDRSYTRASQMPHFYTMFDEPRFIEFISSTQFLSSTGSGALGLLYNLGTPHYLQMLWVYDEELCEHEDHFVALFVSKDAGLAFRRPTVLNGYNYVSVAHNLWRRLMNKFIGRVGANSLTYVAGLNPATIDTTNFDEKLNQFVRELVHVNAFTNLKNAQAGKFNSPVSSSIRDLNS